MQGRVFDSLMVLMTTNQKGRISELVAFAKFISLGYTVLTPINKDGVYDCIIERGGEFKRVQIKTARKAVSGSIIVPLRSTSHNRTGNTVKGYSANDVDLICGVLPENNKVYLLPVGIRNSEIYIDENGEYLI